MLECFLCVPSVKHLSAYIKGAPIYYNGDKGLPILEKIQLHRKRLYSVEDVARILLHPLMKSSKFVAIKVPTSISESVSFVVNLDCLDAHEDVLADDMGVWRNNGVDLTRLHVSFQNSSPNEVRKVSPKDVHSTNTYCVKRVYWIRATDSSLRKITAFVYGKYLARS